jgi:predicted RNA methylase
MQVVVDLGCGCGVLSIAAVLMGAGHSVGIDIDPGALEVAQENIDGFEDLHLDLVQCSVDQMGGLGLKADTVLMNPPFGTRRKVQNNIK